METVREALRSFALLRINGDSKRGIEFLAGRVIILQKKETVW